MKRRHIGLALLHCTAFTLLHALIKSCGGVTMKDPLHGKAFGYISSLEKQNTANSVHLKQITMIKRKKKKFILSKKKRDVNMLIMVSAPQKEGADGLRMSPPLCMLRQDFQDPSDGGSSQSGGSGEDGGGFPDEGDEADHLGKGEPNRELQPACEALFPSSPGHDDGDDVEDEQEERRRRKKKRKKKAESKGGRSSPTDEGSSPGRNEDVVDADTPGYDADTAEYDADTAEYDADTPEYDAHLANIASSYAKKAEAVKEEQLAGLDKEKMLEEYNRLVELLKESGRKKMSEYEGNEKKDTYELNERVINSSRRLNLAKMKREIERSFTPNDAVEKKIRDYMHVFTQSVGAADGGTRESGATGGGTRESGATGGGTRESGATGGGTRESGTPDGSTSDGGTRESGAMGGGTGDPPQDALLQEEEEKENREILKRLSRGDYSGVDRFNFKFSAKDLDMMKNLESTEGESGEERKLIDAAFDRLMRDNPVVKELRGQEKAFLQLYERGRRDNVIERDEHVENLKYYNRVSGGESTSNHDGGPGHPPLSPPLSPRELIDRKLLFNRVPSQFVDIKKEDIEEMSEAQVRDELRKRGYPTFGSVKEIKMRLQDVMRVRKNHHYDIRSILKDPERHVLSHIRLDKLKEQLKQFKEHERCGDTESKIKQLDAAMEITSFVNDPVDYLRIDTTEGFAGLADGQQQMEEAEEAEQTDEDLAKVPIVNDCNISEQISMAEKLRKSFTLEGDERQPDRVVPLESEDHPASASAEEQTEQTEELHRREVLQFGGLQETVEEFHRKHSLPLDFIGDFICKVSSQSTQNINRYRRRRKDEVASLQKNQYELMLRGNSINRDFIVYKFVQTNELIRRYLTTKDIVTLIEYSNMADPVDVIHFYSPETIFMLSEEYGITVDRVIDACTRLDIRLPFGGDTRLNAPCFNALTALLARLAAGSAAGSAAG
ncbi:hypothetical protein PVMG_01696 [Plasmodium vivax Mauritania I]|uniref:SAP domain-containing protein n=2 Tax=Plasmodium vivax TaxID=5855 RepID=A0A0J9T5G8_PLAVI|nr:hypothetical protein PVMG_01696 [Plasmodium vivax Mauritania I]